MEVIELAKNGQYIYKSSFVIMFFVLTLKVITIM